MNDASSFGWSSLVLPACAAIAVGLFVAAMHPPGMRKNAGKGRRQRRPAPRIMKQRKGRPKGSLVSRGILVAPEKGLG